MRVATVIMSHPDRDAMVGRLAADLDGPVQIVRDDHESGPWPTAKRAWSRGVETGAPWILLLQDDARPCDSLLAHCRHISGCGERCVCLYATDSKRRREGVKRADGHWMQVRFSTWGVGVLMPRAWAVDFVHWCAHAVPGDYPHDDTRLTWWLQEQGKSAWVPLPNLVDHRDTDSLLGHPGGQTAVSFDADPGDVCWGRGLDDAPVVRGQPLDSRSDYVD